MRLQTLQAISEAATGYYGGRAVDTHPHLSLYEATSQLPLVIIEAGNGFVDNRWAATEALSEAAISAVQYGYAPDYKALSEGVFANLKDKITKFFDKIIAFIKSIIAKLKVQIDKIRLSGSQLYDKYASKPEYRDKEPKDLTVEGYMFSKGASPFGNAAESISSAESVEKLVNEAIGKPIDIAGMTAEVTKKAMSSSGNTSADDVRNQFQEKAEEYYENLTDTTKEERIAHIANTLTGGSYDLSSSSWQDTLRKELWGEKKDIKYGTAPFTKSEIASILKNALDLDKIRSRYEKVQKAAEDQKAKYQKELDVLTKADEKMMTEVDKIDRSDKASGLEKDAASVGKNIHAMMSSVTNVYNAYMAVCTDVYNTASTVNNIEVQYAKDRAAQAKMFFGKILSYNAKKSNSDAAGIDDFEDFDVII